MADPFNFSQIDLNNPFSGTARQGTIGNVIFGQPTVAGRAAGSTSAFAQRVLEKLGQGGGLQNFETILLQELTTPEGQAALTQPGFLEEMEKLKEAITKEPTALINQPAGSRSLDVITGETGEINPGAPTALQKQVDAIAAERDPEKKRLLEENLPKGTDGKLEIDDYFIAVAAGLTIKPENAPLGVTATQQQAQMVVALKKSLTTGAPRSVTQAEINLAAFRNNPNIPRDVARNVMLAQEATRAKQTNAMIQLFGSLSGKTIPGFDPGGDAGLQGVFNAFDEAKGEEVRAPGTAGTVKGEVPIQGGQAPGPKVKNFTPKQIKEFVAIPPENFSQLSFDTLVDIKIALDDGELTLSDEQRAAFLAALNAKAVEQGGARTQ